MMLRSIEGLPINFGFYGKGNCSGRGPLVEQLKAGAAGFKVHEDYGSTPAAIRAALTVADDYDVSVAIHTDTLNEAGYVEDTIAAFDGRTIHTYHSEGAGGGHAPDLLKVVGQSNVLPSSTNPTLPCGINSVAELFDMIMVCHNLNPKIPSDVAFAESRVRAETIVAESVLHDMGAISMIGSDSPGHGPDRRELPARHPDRRRDEAGARQAARGRRRQRQLPGAALRRQGDDQPGDHRRHLARASARSTPGKIADLVLWEPAFFGAKPKLVLKGGFIVWANMGDPNASLPTPQPMYYRPMFGAFGRPLRQDLRTASCRGPPIDEGIGEKYGLQRPLAAGVADPRARQAAHGAQRLPARHRRQPADLRGDGRRRARHRDAAEDHLAQPALLLQLMAASTAGSSLTE